MSFFNRKWTSDKAATKYRSTVKTKASGLYKRVQIEALAFLRWRNGNTVLLMMLWSDKHELCTYWQTNNYVINQDQSIIDFRTYNILFCELLIRIKVRLRLGWILGLEIGITLFYDRLIYFKKLYLIQWIMLILGI